MSEHGPELCEQCEKNPGEDPHLCAYNLAAGSAKGWSIEQQEARCNCCDECTHHCWMRS